MFVRGYKRSNQTLAWLVQYTGSAFPRRRNGVLVQGKALDLNGDVQSLNCCVFVGLKTKLASAGPQEDL